MESKEEKLAILRLPVLSYFPLQEHTPQDDVEIMFCAITSESRLL